MANDLHSLIVGVLQPMTHAELNEAPSRIAGLVVPTGDGLSNRQRVDLALANLTEEELARLALKFAAQRGDIPLDEAGRKVLEAGDLPLNISLGAMSRASSETTLPASATRWRW
jgi:hypothetical protein